MTEILITGAAGFIGSSLAGYLLTRSGIRLTLIDNFSTGKKENLPKIKPDRWQFINCDVNNYSDLSEIFSSRRFDFVFHYAAVVGVKRTLSHPLNVLNDLQGMRYLLNLCKNTSVKRVFFSSSSEVYGEPVEFPQHEQRTPLNSRLPYAVVKNAGEALLKAYHQEHGLNYTVFRFFNTYGPKQNYDFVIPIFISRALKGFDLPINGDGLQTRTFCYIDDNIASTTTALFKNLYINDVVNIGDPAETSILDLAQTVIRLTKSKSKITHLPALTEGDMSRRQPDVTKMKKLLNRPLTPLSVGLRHTVGSLKLRNP